MATAHVPRHALGGAYYALKAVVAADPANAGVNIARERNWQSRRLPENLRQEILDKIIIQERDDGVFIKIEKGRDF